MLVDFIDMSATGYLDSNKLLIKKVGVNMRVKDDDTGEYNVRLTVPNQRLEVRKSKLEQGTNV